MHDFNVRSPHETGMPKMRRVAGDSDYVHTAAFEGSQTGQQRQPGLVAAPLDSGGSIRNLRHIMDERRYMVLVGSGGGGGHYFRQKIDGGSRTHTTQYADQTSPRNFQHAEMIGPGCFSAPMQR